jgi:hypothetical protein
MAWGSNEGPWGPGVGDGKEREGGFNIPPWFVTEKLSFVNLNKNHFHLLLIYLNLIKSLINK